MLGEHVFSDVPHLKVFTVVDHSYYNGWLAGVSRKTDTKDDRAELAADRAKAIVTVGAVMSVRTGEKALFMSNVETRKLIEPQIASFGSALNYGALAGRDEFHRHVEILIGRNQPDHSAVEDMLMALVGRVIARQPYVKTDAAVTLRSPDGSLHQITVQSDQHLSPLCEMIRWHLCEGQHEQPRDQPRDQSRELSGERYGDPYAQRRPDPRCQRELFVFWVSQKYCLPACVLR